MLLSCSGQAGRFVYLAADQSCVLASDPAAVVVDGHRAVPANMLDRAAGCVGPGGFHRTLSPLRKGRRPPSGP